MKRLLLSILLSVVFGFATLAENKQRLTINGEVVEKVVAKITFDGDMVVLHFDDDTQQSVEMSSVVLSFDWEGTGIHAVHKPVGDLLSIKDLEPGTEVTVYDAAGKKMMTTTAETMSVVMSAKSLTPGIYLLKAGRQVIKFTKQ